jgi:hypothetical protein
MAAKRRARQGARHPARQKISFACSMSDDEYGWETDDSDHIEPPKVERPAVIINRPTYLVKINRYNNMEFSLTPDQTIIAKHGLQTAINKLELTGSEWAVPKKTLVLHSLKRIQKRPTTSITKAYSSFCSGSAISSQPLYYQTLT